MHYIVLTIIISLLFQSTTSFDGAIGFQVEFDESGAEFRHFHNVLSSTFNDYSPNLDRYVVGRDNLTVIENAFRWTNRADSSIPRIMAKLKNELCALKERFFPTLGATRWRMPEFIEISMAVDGGEVHDTIASVLRRFGLSSYPAEYDRMKSEMFSPRRIILARIPRDVTFPDIPVTWKTVSDVKVKARVALFKCDSNWQKSDCAPVSWVDIDNSFLHALHTCASLSNTSKVYSLVKQPSFGEAALSYLLESMIWNSLHNRCYLTSTVYCLLWTTIFDRDRENVSTFRVPTTPDIKFDYPHFVFA